MSTRESFTQLEKENIRNEFNTRPSNTTLSEFANKKGISKTTLSGLLKSEPSIDHPSKKRKRKSAFDDVDKALVLWFTDKRANRVPLSGPLLKQKAEEFAKQLEYKNWVCSDGWLHRWKQRNSIVYRTISGEANLVCPNSIHQWQKDTMTPFLKDFAPDDIFNADETGVFWRLLPSKTFCFKGETCQDGKKSKERVTVLLCANMTATEKLPILVIGKFAKPRCFKNLPIQPCPYYSSKNAWMTGTIFHDFLLKWNSRLMRQGRNICLILDNCSAHRVPTVSNIKILFLPPNTTAVAQPLDCGVINSFKQHYRHRILSKNTEHIDMEHGEFSISLLQSLKTTTVILKTSMIKATSCHLFHINKHGKR